MKSGYSAFNSSGVLISFSFIGGRLTTSSLPPFLVGGGVLNLLSALSLIFSGVLARGAVYDAPPTFQGVSKKCKVL